MTFEHFVLKVKTAIKFFSTLDATESKMMLLLSDKAFLHYIAELRSNKKTKYEGKIIVLQLIIKTLNEFYRCKLPTS